MHEYSLLFSSISSLVKGKDLSVFRNLCFIHKKYDDALKVIEKACSLKFSSLGKAYEEKGNIYYKMKKIKEARKAWKEAGKHDPKLLKKYRDIDKKSSEDKEK